MKLVSFDDFCKMPAGTIFAPYEPCVLEEELSIKVDPGTEMPKDYPYYRHGFNGVMPLRPWLGDSCTLFSIGDREDASFEIYDGCNADYMDYKMFLIFEETDVERFIDAIVWAKNGCKDGCDYCNGKKYLAERSGPLSYKGEFTPGIEVCIDGDILSVDSIADVYEPNFTEEDIKIRYCPMCGRPLKIQEVDGDNE